MSTKLALITILDGSISDRPDNTLPGGRPPRPDQGLPPSPGKPDNTLPGGPPEHPWIPGHLPPIGAVLPVPPPVGPDNTLPEGGDAPIISLPIVLPKPPSGGKPDNTLPAVDRDQKFELKWSPVYGWVLVPVKDTGAQPKSSR